MKWFVWVSFLVACSGGNFTENTGGPPLDAGDAGATDSAAVGETRGADGASDGAPDDALTPAGCADSSACGGLKVCWKVCGAATGTCKLRPVPSVAFDPVCGCDGVTYWNLATAVDNGMFAKASGVCPAADASTCSSTKPCKSGHCVFTVPTEGDCGADSKNGTCWQAPPAAVCGGSTVGGSARSCGGGGCQTLCEAVRTGETLFATGCAL